MSESEGDCIGMIYINDVSNLIAPSMLICVSQMLLSAGVGRHESYARQRWMNRRRNRGQRP